MSQADDTDTMPPGVFLNDLVREFCAMEEKLRAIYDFDRERLDPVTAERLRLDGGLLSFATLLQKTNIDEKIVASFRNLAFALRELDNKGRVVPLLTPIKPGSGRQVDRFDMQMVRVSVVAGLEALIHADQSEKPQEKKEIAAARYIARKYPIFERLIVERKQRKPSEDDAPVRKEDYLAWPIKSWLKSFLKKPVEGDKNDDAKRIFNDTRPRFLAEFKRIGPENCKAYADELLTKAAKEAEALLIPVEPSEQGEWSGLPAGPNIH